MIKNRKKGPPILPLSDINLPEVSFYTLTNGIPVYEINTGTQDAFKIEILSIGGRLLEDKRMVSRSTASLIRDATEDYTQKELAHTLDYYGASLGTKHNLDVTSLTLFALGKYGEILIPVLASIFLRPVFSSSELEKYISRNINDLQIQLTKNDVLAYREFTGEIFGEDHIYGYNSNEVDYRNLRVEDLLFHFQRYYGIQNTVIILSGKIHESLRKAIDRELGQFRKESMIKSYVPSTVPVARKIFHRKGHKDVQDSVIIGRKIFDKEHLDYPGMVVANTILGGYFGSRLMKSIREDKGYTYNISSIMDMLKYDGYFYISTDVDPHNTRYTLAEIYRQIEKLRNEPVNAGELQMVKNYIIGNILNSLDGPFKISSWVKSLIINDLSLLRGHEIINQIRHCSSEMVLEIFNRYFRIEDLTELVVSAR